MNTYKYNFINKNNKNSNLFLESLGQCLVEPQDKKGDIITTLTKISEDKIEILWRSEKSVLEKAK